MDHIKDTDHLISISTTYYCNRNNNKKTQMSFNRNYIINEDDQIGYDAIMDRNKKQLFGKFSKYVIKTFENNIEVYRAKLILKSNNPNMMGCLSLIKFIRDNYSNDILKIFTSLLIDSFGVEDKNTNTMKMIIYKFAAPTTDERLIKHLQYLFDHSMNLLFDNSALSQNMGINDTQLYFDLNQTMNKCRTFIIKRMKLNTTCPDIRRMQNIKSVTETIINTFPEFNMNSISWRAKIDVNRKKITSNIRIMTANISGNFMKQENNIKRSQIWDGITLSAWPIELIEIGRDKKFKKQYDMEMKINDEAHDEIIEKYTATVENLLNDDLALKQEMNSMKQRFVALLADAVQIKGIQLLSEDDVSKLAKNVDLSKDELLTNSQIKFKVKDEIIYFSKSDDQDQQNKEIDFLGKFNLLNSSNSSAAELFQDLLPIITKYENFKAEIQKRSQHQT